MSDDGRSSDERSSSDEHHIDDGEAGETFDMREVLGVDEIVERLPEFFTVSIASRRNSGKSHLCRQLVQMLLKRKRVDVCLVLSGTVGLNKDWNFMPSGLVQNFSEEVMINLWRRQEKSMYDWQAARCPKKQTPQHVLCVLDDCFSDPAALGSKVIEMYYTKGRHVCVSLIVISQHTSHLLTPVIRANSDLILFSKLSKRQLRCLADEVTHISESDFIRVSEMLAGHYRFIVIDKFIQSTDPVDCITVVRADAKSR